MKRFICLDEDHKSNTKKIKIEWSTTYQTSNQTQPTTHQTQQTDKLERNLYIQEVCQGPMSFMTIFVH